MKKYFVKYKYKFPLDAWDRPGGQYSLADLPIRSHKVLTREGIILSKNDEHDMFKIKDLHEKLITVWVDKSDVEILNPWKNY